MYNVSKVLLALNLIGLCRLEVFWEITGVMRKYGLSKFAVGALLACEVGSLGASANFVEVMDSIPGVSGLKSVAEKTVEFAKSNPFLFSTMFGPWLARFFSSLPGYFSEGKNYIKSLFENSGDFSTEEEAAEKLREGFGRVQGFEDAKRNFLELSQMIAGSKKIQVNDESEDENEKAKQTHIVLVTGANNSSREMLVNAFASSLYSGSILNLDLTKCSSKGEIISALLPGERDFFSGSKSDTSGDKLEKYKKANEHGVVVIRLSKEGLKASDGIFSRLLDYNSNGSVTLKGKNFETGNLTLVITVENDIPDIDSLEFLNFADYVQLSTNNSKGEVATLLKSAFKDQVSHWQNEDVNVNTKLLLKSMYEALIESESGGLEFSIKGLVEDFKRYMIKNKNKFLGKNVPVYYDKESGEFSVKTKNQRKVENDKVESQKKFNKKNSQRQM